MTLASWSFLVFHHLFRLLVHSLVLSSNCILELHQYERLNVNSQLKENFLNFRLRGWNCTYMGLVQWPVHSNSSA